MSALMARRERTLDQPAEPPRPVDGSQRLPRGALGPGTLGMEEGAAAVRGRSGRYPLRLRSSMARTRVLGVMSRRPASSRMLGRAGFRVARPPSVPWLRGAVNCQRIGIGLCVSTRWCIDATPILYGYTSTLQQSVKDRLHPGIPPGRLISFGGRLPSMPIAVCTPREAPACRHTPSSKDLGFKNSGRHCTTPVCGDAVSRLHGSSDHARGVGPGRCLRQRPGCVRSGEHGDGGGPDGPARADLHRPHRATSTGLAATPGTPPTATLVRCEGALVDDRSI